MRQKFCKLVDMSLHFLQRYHPKFPFQSLLSLSPWLVEVMGSSSIFPSSQTVDSKLNGLNLSKKLEPPFESKEFIEVLLLADCY